MAKITAARIRNAPIPDGRIAACRSAADQDRVLESLRSACDLSDLPPDCCLAWRALAGFCNVEEPDNIGPDWSIRFTLQLLFPRGGMHSRPVGKPFEMKENRSLWFNTENLTG
jgi:hypothetical protein